MRDFPVIGIIGAGIAVVVVVASCVVYPFAYHASADDVTFTVESKERIVEGTGKSVSSRYLVFTDGEVFEVTDSVVFWRFDASDDYGALKVDHTYEAKVAGWRVPFLSMYRNVLEAHEL